MARKKDGTFLPGTSGNPGGRPKAPIRLRELYDRDDCDDLVYKRLRFWMDQEEDGGIALRAIATLLERRYGRAPAVDDNGDIVSDSTINVILPTYE